MISRTTLKAQAYEYLKKGIIDGTFKRDTLYSEKGFAEILGISRTPVREALMRLEKEHYVQVLLNRGVIIKPVNSDSILYVTQLRAAIEGFCSILLAESHATPKGKETIERLKTICNKQDELLKLISEDDHSIDAKWLDLDLSFHNSIDNFPNNGRINTVMEEIHSYISYIGMVTAGFSHRKLESVKENRMLIDALEKGDSVKAYNLSRQHVEKICKLIIDSNAN